MTYQIHLGDCVATMRAMPDASVDSIVTDPPYELGFMGKSWDASGIAYSVEMWREALRVLKPGGHLLAFSGSRTYHRMVVAIEDAGFEVRDQIMWVYGSGFPKSLDVSKAIDKAAGAEREVIGARAWSNAKMDAGNGVSGLRQAGGHAGEYEAARVNVPVTAPATDAARQWQGWGTALKPAHEPICVARKPLVGTVAANVLQHGTGALNVDGCRVGMAEGEINPSIARYASTPQQGNNGWGHVNRGANFDDVAAASAALGRWPANLIHDGSNEALTAFPQDASRFYYAAKASKKDRNSGGVVSSHPTVKPTDLMRYLVRLVTPPGGLVLDPFTGSGSTGKAAMLEGFRFVGCELSPEYAAIAEARISAAACGGFA